MYSSFIESASDIIVGFEKTTKRRKLFETEDELKLQRLHNIMDQEQQLSKVKLQHEERMAAIREAHIIEVNKLELKALVAKSELAELILNKEKDTVQLTYIQE